MFGLFKRKDKESKDPIVITEGIESTFHYHYSKGYDATRSLCGKSVMPTGMSLESWGHNYSHIGETYCQECENLKEALG